MTEIWKEIGNGYFVSNLGNVRHGEKRLTIQYNAYPKYGYVNVNGRAYRVHKLVARAFIPNPNGYTEVNHIDCDKTNNRADNLEWISHKENIRHAAESGRMAHSRARRPVVAFTDQGYQVYGSINEAAKLTRKPLSTVFSALRRGGAAGGIRYAYQSEAERSFV